LVRVRALWDGDQHVNHRITSANGGAPKFSDDLNLG
jgi:hypothetical protein